MTSDQIDANVLEARRAYHQVDDAANRLLDTSVFDDDQIFDKVRFVDFYRYVDVGLDELYAYLEQRVPWTRPTDTGRSTNCLINDVGIYVHRTTQGFHNYALPYSWDVRLGHKQREAAIGELTDHIDAYQVGEILDEIDYQDPELQADGNTRLVAWYEAERDPGSEALRKFVRQKLPESMVPTWFMPVSSMPLTHNGKIDKEKLPDPRHLRPELLAAAVLPTSEEEILMAKLWQEALRIDGVGIHDNFFDLGGDSIVAIQIVSAAAHHGLQITPNQLFLHQTIASLLPTLSTEPSAREEGASNAESFELVDEDLLGDLASELSRD